MKRLSEIPAGKHLNIWFIVDGLGMVVKENMKSEIRNQTILDNETIDLLHSCYRFM